MNFDSLNIRGESRWILIGAALFLCFSTWLFFDEGVMSYLMGDRIVENPSVGTLVKIENDVRRKSSHELTWESSKKSQTFQKGDSVYVGSKSEASFMLQDGGTLSISSDTLVTFNSEVKKNELHLGKGKVEIAPNEDLTITVGNKTLSLKKGSRVSLNKENHSVKIVVEKGEAQVVNPEKAPQSLAVQQDIFVDTGPSEALLENDLPADVSAEADETPAPKINTADIAGDSEAPPLDQEPEQVKPQAPAATEKKAVVKMELGTNLENYSFKKTSQPLTIKALSPKPGFEFIFYSDQSHPSVEFKWSGQENYQVHLQVSKSSDFVDNSIDVVTSDESFASSDLRVGNYFWRVRAEISEANSPWSAPAALTITQAILLKKTDLIYPLGKIFVQSASSIQYRWQSSYDAHRYVLSINDSRLGQKTFFTVGKSQNVLFLGQTKVNWKVYALLDREVLEDSRLPASEDVASAEIAGVHHELTLGIDYHSSSNTQQGPTALSLNAQGQGPDLNLVYSERLQDSNLWISAQAQLQSNSLSGSGSSAQAINLDYSLGMERRFGNESTSLWTAGAKLEKISTEVLTTSNTIYTLSDFYFSPYISFKIPLRENKDQLELRAKYSTEMAYPLKLWFITPEVVWWHDDSWGYSLSYKSQYPYYSLPYGPINSNGALSFQSQQINAGISYKFKY